MATVPKMLFFHIGWMKQYRGPNDDDPTIGPHRYLQDNKFGAECFNFMPRDGSCYGYVPSGIDLSNLGASRSTNHVDDVVCVWIAKDPDRQARVVVGWYTTARVFGSSNHRIRPSGNKLHGKDIGYRAVAPEVECSLVPVARRTFEIPTRHDEEGGLGQSPVWYGGNAGFREKVWKYIKNWERRKKGKKRRPTSTRRPRGGRNIDPEQRKMIETIAIDIAANFFRSADGGGYRVISKETDNVGWDLEASRSGKATLLIEVKGLSGQKVSVELTPNEYKQMISKKNRDNYVLFVVTDCLGNRPMTHDYRFKGGRWTDADGTVLKLSERIGAICRPAR